MHLILTGATGLIGTAVLHHILALPAAHPVAQKISRLSIISRRADIPLLEHPDRPRQNTHTKVEVLVHKDFKDYEKDGLLNKLREGDDNEKIGVIWALGMSQVLATSEQQYDEITRVYALEAAKALPTGLNPKQLNFVYVSGEGATAKPGLFTAMFGKVKGRTEMELLDLMKTSPFNNSLKVFNARPGGVDAGAETDQELVNSLTRLHDGGTGGVSRSSVGYKIGEVAVYPLLRAGIWKGVHSPTGELARVLVDMAVGDGEPIRAKGTEQDGRILPNVALRRLGGSIPSA